MKASLCPEVGSGCGNMGGAEQRAASYCFQPHKTRQWPRSTDRDSAQNRQRSGMANQDATTPRPHGDLTALLSTLGAGGLGDQRAADALLPAVYEELRAMAQAMLRSEH